MPTRLVSMSEIMRVAPWSLRALGHPFGVAERATRLLTWSEAAVGNALKMLRVGEDALRKSIAAAPASRSIDANFARVIEAKGRNLLELGPPAIDLATNDARTRGHSDIVVRDSIASLLLPAMADLAVRRGLGIIITYSMGADDVPFETWPKSGWIQGMPAVGASRFILGTLQELMIASAQLDEPLASIVNRHASLCIEAASVGKGIAAIATTSASIPGLTEAGEVIDYSERVSRAYRSGLAAATEDLAHLYDLERITWAPTSERSRKQAGY